VDIEDTRHVSEDTACSVGVQVPGRRYLGNGDLALAHIEHTYASKSATLFDVHMIVPSNRPLAGNGPLRRRTHD
jgi:hypothetical protein